MKMYEPYDCIIPIPTQINSMRQKLKFGQSQRLRIVEIV